jgi:integrase
MKPFESALSAQLEEYMKYRQSLGYIDKALCTNLLIFDRYVKEKKADWHLLHPLFFLKFRENLKGERSTINAILSAVYGFFQFLVRKALMKENPLKDIPPLKERAYIPFIFSPQETDQLVKAIEKGLSKTKKKFLQDLGVYLAIVLMARCGLRISEPRHLLRTHYRSDDGTLYIEKTKFKKDRVIPLPKTVMVEIENYLAVRNCLVCDDASPYLLSSDTHRPVSKKKIYKFFHRSVKDSGLDQPRRVIGNVIFASPTPHSFRHSFAVNTLKRIKENGKSPQAALPILAAYMGHRKYDYTAIYLKLLNAEHRQGLVDFNTFHSEEI